MINFGELFAKASDLELFYVGQDDFPSLEIRDAGNDSAFHYFYGLFAVPGERSR